MLARCVGLRGSLKFFLQRRGGNESLHNNADHASASPIVTSASAPVLNSKPNTLGFTSGGVGIGMPAITRNQSLNFSNVSIPHSGSGGTACTYKGRCSVTNFLNTFLDFPLLSSENTQNYVKDRDELFSLLRSFASASAVPIHLLLFPEGWPEGQDRKSMIAKSVEFAKREGRPQLKHLLLPRTTGFYASLDSLREASPVVYDVTMAYRGYDGQSPFSCDVSIHSLLRLIQGRIPNEVHIRIKRYSMEEVLSDPNWLDKQWKEKDRLLDYFERHGVFPVDNRGFCRHVVMDTKTHSVESSLSSSIRLLFIPFAIPIILFLAVPLFFSVGWIWLAHRSFLLLFPGGIGSLGGSAGGMRGDGTSGSGTEEPNMNSNGGTDSAVGTPFFPATPFASPTHVASWTSAPTTKQDSSDSSKNKKRR